jgi:endonuclease IV
MTELDIKKIIKDILKLELEKINKKIDSNKDDLSSLKKSSMDEEAVRKLVRTMFVNHYKWMWEKSSIYINRL